MQKFNMIRDINGYNGFGLKFPDYVWKTILTASVEQTFTLAGSPFADYSRLLLIFVFSPGSMVWVSKNSTAVAPTGSFTLGNSEANPTARSASGGDVIHFITNDAQDEVCVSVYAY